MVSSISSLLLGFALLVMGNGLLGTLIALRMVHANFPLMTVGPIQAAYYLGFMLGAWRGGSLIARIGHHRAFATFAAVAACTALGYAVSIQSLIWGGLRFMTGFCMVGIFTVMESWLNGVARNEWRGRVFSVYLITTYLCVGAGQFLVSMTDPYGFELFSLVGCLFAASLVPVTLARSRAAEASAHAHDCTQESRSGLGLDGVRSLCRLAPLGLCGCLAAGLLNSVFYSLYPVYMRSAGYPVSAVSHFMGTALIAALLPQWPVAHLSDRVDRRWVMLAVSLLLALSSVTLFLLHGDGLPQPVAYLYVSLMFTVYGLSIAHANDRVPSTHRVGASAGLLLIFALGGSTGPIAASLVMTWAGPQGIYLFTMAVTAVLAMPILLSVSAHRGMARAA
ncbi:MFS transporter [Paraburkholderia dipogonis]|uniref:MFS transporter n=1 Tax=Paraburkholderia dipogonis TaxID=1211383 RepID=UPI0038B729F6